MRQDESGPINRRLLLKGLGVLASTGVLGSFLAACGGSRAPAAQPTSTAASGAPTSAPAASPTTAPAAQGAAAANGKTVITWMGWGGFDQNIATMREPLLEQYFPNLAEKYALKGISGGKGDFDMAQKLRLMLAAGGSELPDVNYFNYTQIPEFYSAGELLELDSAIAPYKADLSNAALLLSQYKGKTVTFPDSAKGKVSFYRQDLLAQANLTWADFKTIDDFVLGAKEFHSKLSKSYLLNLDGNPAQYWMGEILSAYVPNIQIADDSGKYQITSNPAFRVMFETLKKLESISVNIDDFTNDWPPAFANDTICGSILATWMINFLPKYAPKQKGLWKIDQWPTIDGKVGGSEAGGGVNAFWAKSKNRDAAIEVVGNLMLSRQGATGNIILNGQIPLVKSVQAEAKKYFQQYKPAGGQDPNLFVTNYFGEDALDAIFASYQSFKVLPYDPHATQEMTILQQWLSKYLQDKSSIGEALAGAQSDMESQIGNPYKS